MPTLSFRRLLYLFGIALILQVGQVELRADGFDGLEKLPFIERVDASINSRNYVDRVKDGRQERYYEFRNDLRIGSDLRFNNSLSGRVSAEQYLHYGVNSEDGYGPEQTSLRLREAYLDYHSSSFDARVGHQIIRWGKGDEVNPIDNFTPQNFREFLNLDKSERKLPVTAAYLKYFANESTRAEALWMPFFSETRFAGSDQDWEFFFRRAYREAFMLDDIPESKPANSLKNSSAATRIVREGVQGDFALSYAYHYDTDVIYKVQTNSALLTLGESPVLGVFERLHTLGLDFETTAGKYGLRGEAAYIVKKPQVTQDLEDDDLVKRKDTIATLIGVDYTFDNQLYVNFQILQDIIPERESGMFWQAYEGSLTSRVSRRFYQDKLELEFRGRSYYTHRDYFFATGGTYEVWERFTVTSEYHHFGGNEQRIFGQFKDNDQFFLGAKYVF